MSPRRWYPNAIRPLVRAISTPSLIMPCSSDRDHGRPGSNASVIRSASSRVVRAAAELCDLGNGLADEVPARVVVAACSPGQAHVHGLEVGGAHRYQASGTELKPCRAQRLQRFTGQLEVERIAELRG